MHYVFPMALPSISGRVARQIIPLWIFNSVKENAPRVCVRAFSKLFWWMVREEGIRESASEQPKSSVTSAHMRSWFSDRYLWVHKDPKAPATY